MKGQFFPYRDETERKRRPYVTYAIIVACVVIFIWSLTNFDAIISRYGFVPAQATLLTLFTSMFLHGGLDHIFGNMWYLWIFGDNVEDRFGRIRYILFYLASGLAAAGVHWLTDPRSTVPTIGASGAISGVLGAYVVMFPKARVHTLGPAYTHVMLPAFALIGFWFVLQLIFGMVSLVGGYASGIAFWAHVGGFVFGAGVTGAGRALGFIKIEKKIK
jgi:membrane associated rhomboid family serine protease